MLILLLCTLALGSCGILRKPEPVIEYRDSVRVEYRDRIVHDTIPFNIPVIIERNVTRDTSSHLENAYARSDAAVYDGFLSHSLESIPQTIYVPVEVPVTDTLFVEKEAQIVEKTVEVPAELSWWQRFRIGAFWWLVALCLVGWRREILKLIKLI